MGSQSGRFDGETKEYVLADTASPYDKISKGGIIEFDLNADNELTISGSDQVQCIF